MTTNERIKVTKEEKAKLIERMMPPHNQSISQISKETGIKENRLYNWRKLARQAGSPTPGNGKSSDKWSSQDKFLIVVETMSMNEVELGEYCRKKGLYREQINEWKKVCLNANGNQKNQNKDLSAELKEEQKRKKELEKELRKKEKALAEAAALLLLRKKANAIWGDNEDEA